MNSKPDLYINVSQVREMTGLNRETIRKYVKEGILKGHSRENKLRTKWYISFNSVMDYLNRS